MKIQNWLNTHEIPICIYFNKANHRNSLSRFFGSVSRLGDGVFWYSIISLLPLIHGWEAIKVSMHMLLVGGIALLIYKALKLLTIRHRPFQFSLDIVQTVRALDIYSFPSGHTMHAISFSTVLLSYYPQWFWLVVPFSVMVATSRLVLGLHYPTDVLVGGLIGFSIASVSIGLF